MKILIVNSEDITGGAAIAINRVHNGLLEKDINSSMLVMNKKSQDNNIFALSSKKDKFLNILSPHIDAEFVKRYKDREAELFSTSINPLGNFIKFINDFNPDIVHLNWINQGMIKIEDLAKINAPMVWTMQDMWAFTGGCHYTKDCDKFTTHCQKCDLLNSNKEKDLSYKVFNRKKTTYDKLNNIYFVGVSNWIVNEAKKSTLLKNQNIRFIPDLVSTKQYKPIETNIARDILSLPKDKKLILFGALDISNDKRKGANELFEALTKLKSENIEIVLLGGVNSKKDIKLNYPIHFMGQLNDDISKNLIYSACDVTIIPSRQEAFGLMTVESMASGTPTIAFNHTGFQDTIEHKSTGYLAKPLDTQDLANGIDWVLNSGKYDDLVTNCIKKVNDEFSFDVVAERYINLYEEILNKKNGIL